jgi:hypothetical protein
VKLTPSTAVFDPYLLVRLVASIMSMSSRVLGWT